MNYTEIYIAANIAYLQAMEKECKYDIYLGPFLLNEIVYAD